jgi:hypothetical protein
LNRLAAHSAIGKILAGSLQDHRDSKPGAGQPATLSEKAAVLDRGDEVEKPLALDE